MRSATKSKMAKIQNYGREHGEECPYKLNMVERLIWDTFSVKPEEYMKDLNMKWCREKHQLERGQQSSAFAMTIDSESGSSADVSLTQGFESASRSNILESTAAIGVSSWQEPITFGTGREVAPLPAMSFVRPNLEPTVAQTSSGVVQDSGYPHATPGMGYQGPCQGPYTPMHARNAGEVEQWLHSVSSSGDLEDVSVVQNKRQGLDLIHCVI
uniref:Uncharacterized protein n=1 Tax=Anopheles atroparvus TaxID=41427 RepID=A0A182JGM4_ANOAO